MSSVPAIGALAGCGGGLDVAEGGGGNPTHGTAREKAGLRRGVCGWED